MQARFVFVQEGYKGRKSYTEMSQAFDQGASMFTKNNSSKV